MASHIQDTTGSGTDSASAAFSSNAFGSNTTSGNTIFGFVYSTVGFPSDAKDSAGNTYTLLTGQAFGSFNLAHVIPFYCTNIVGGSSVTLTFNTTSPNFVGFYAVVAQEWSGLAISSVVDVSAINSPGTHSNNGSNNAAAVTTTNPNDLLVGGFTAQSSGSTNTDWSLGSGFSNLIETSTTAASLAMESKTLSSTGTYTPTMNYNQANINYVGYTVAFKAAGASPSLNSPTMPLLGIS